jgi:hypothetical protein
MPLPRGAAAFFTSRRPPWHAAKEHRSPPARRATLVVAEGGRARSRQAAKAQASARHRRTPAVQRVVECPAPLHPQAAHRRADPRQAGERARRWAGRAAGEADGTTAVLWLGETAEPGIPALPAPTQARARCVCPSRAGVEDVADGLARKAASRPAWVRALVRPRVAIAIPNVALRSLRRNTSPRA